MYKVKILRKFSSHVIGITDYYYTIDINFAIQFESEVKGKQAIANNNPEIYKIRYRDVRRINLENFPFCIFFRIKNKSIIFLDILHQNRDPILWP